MAALLLMLFVTMVSLYVAGKVQAFRVERDDLRNWHSDEGPFWASMHRDR